VARTANEVQVVEAVSGNVLSVRVDGTPQEIAMTKRITELEGVDLSGVDLNYPTDVTLEGLNTYRIRSRIIRGALDTLVLEQYNPDQDATIDDVKVSGFSSFESFGITITRIETTEEPVYENVRDKVGEAYRNYAQVSTFDFFRNALCFERTRRRILCRGWQYALLRCCHRHRRVDFGDDYRPHRELKVSGAWFGTRCHAHPLGDPNRGICEAMVIHAVGQSDWRDE
jgi:hypothetical protein